MKKSFYPKDIRFASRIKTAPFSAGKAKEQMEKRLIDAGRKPHYCLAPKQVLAEPKKIHL